MKYYLGRNGQQMGPYERAELLRMVAEGSVFQTDLVWTEGMPAWAPVFDVIPRAPAPAPVPPPAALAPAPPAPSPAAPSGFSQDLAATQISATPFSFGPSAPASPAVASPSPSPSLSPAGASPASTPAPPAAAAPAPAAQFSPPAAAAPPPAAQPFSPGFPAPAPAAPAPAAFVPPAAIPAGYAGPIPPDMHWPLVYVFSALTIGIFGIYWIFKEMNFVKTIDPSNKSKTMILAGIGLYVLYIVMIIAGTAAGEPSLAAIGALAALAAAICMIMGVFGMRKSLVNYYNSVEPIQLRLSGVMTFFFHFLYFQYHFRRIADWKLGREISQITGRLRP